ncbi:MAG: cell division protein FtsA [Nitrospiraceae bacterium]|nr:cell division protein FtsA [Nitrospiraceae bacterium]
MRGRYIAGIDVGSTKVCAAVARVDSRGMEIIASGTVPSSGLRKGVVVDMDETANSINMAVKEAESVSGIDIKSAYIGISGAHIKSAESYGATGIKGKEVKAKDIERVIDAASAVYVPLDREILHVLPSEFVIDGQDGIARPYGMAGVRLEVKVQVLTASQAVLENLDRALSRTGLKVTEMVFQPLASALAVLKDEEMEQGALLVDMGGGTTDLALLKGGALRFTSVIPVGSQHITNDLALGMKLPQKEAERLKKRYGTAGGEKGNLFSDEKIEAVNMSGKTKSFDHDEIEKIIKLRCEETFELVKNSAEAAILKHEPVCVVLTGGGSQMRDITEMAERWLGLPVRMGVPERVKNSIVRDVVREPQYSTAVGLLLYALQAEGGEKGSSGPLPVLQDSLGAIKDTILGQGWASVKKMVSRIRRPEPGV